VRLENPRVGPLVRSPDLALLLDLDGTLIPFAARAEDAHLDRSGSALLHRLTASGVKIAIVSGRPQALVDNLRAFVPGAWWIAEHGAWRRDARGWECAGERSPDLDQLGDRLFDLADTFAGARVERKSLSVCLHWRQVEAGERSALHAVSDSLIDEWLAAHPEYRRLAGADMVEVGPRHPHKGDAVAWIRERIGASRLIAIGDDLTDEDMFAALAPEDLGIAVGTLTRATRADARLDDVAGVRHFLRWMIEAREAPDTPPVPEELEPRSSAARTDFLVVSNRIPSVVVGREREVGGLVSALEPALRERGGIWLGWSGQEREGPLEVCYEPQAAPPRASFDLSSSSRKLFYAGFCNRVLWPLLHGFPDRLSYDDDEWREYIAGNETYAELAAQIVNPDGAVWMHDYHLLLAGAVLRERGHRGPLAMFLHVPFPSRDVLATLPWAPEILRAMTAFDLIGFQADRWARNFLAAADKVDGCHVELNRITYRERTTVVGVFPIGIEAGAFAPKENAAPSAEIARLLETLGERKLLLGVDRLDYSKGIPQRLDAFERLLERRPEWRRQVSFVQVSVPSRSDVTGYVELRDRVEHQVGRINGRFGEADWVPVRLLCRSYDQDMLAQLYRAADAAVVTPLCDGMNLVAKEFVASQEAEDPGVLVLSKFAGAADDLTAALLTNPYHRDGLADDLHRALSMTLDERKARHAHLHERVVAGTVTRWASEYLAALSLAHATDGSKWKS
jgi:alpha,alpha-trehalose-phosphate synthase [UDP-forming]/trehalose-phosphatase